MTLPPPSVDTLGSAPGARAGKSAAAGSVTPTLVVTDAMNSVFGVGLDLCATRAMVSGEAAERIDRAVAELDSIIERLRSGIYACEQLGQTDATANDHHGRAAMPADPE